MEIKNQRDLIEHKNTIKQLDTITEKYNKLKNEYNNKLYNSKMFAEKSEYLHDELNQI